MILAQKLAFSRHSDQIKALIVENTFSCMSDMVDQLFPYIKHFKKWMLRMEWASVDKIKKVECPICFISGLKVRIMLSPNTFYLSLLFSNILLLRLSPYVCLLLAADQDEVVPPRQMTSLRDAATSCKLKKFIQFPQGKHNTTWNNGGLGNDAYINTLRNFLFEAEALRLKASK
jgi:hypothetical protein